jgi:hypothetical protein
MEIFLGKGNFGGKNLLGKEGFSKIKVSMNEF